MTSPPSFIVLVPGCPPTLPPPFTTGLPRFESPELPTLFPLLPPVLMYGFDRLMYMPPYWSTLLNPAFVAPVDPSFDTFGLNTYGFNIAPPRRSSSRFDVNRCVNPPPKL